MTTNSTSVKLGGMESFLPTFQGTLQLAYPLGTYGNPGLDSTCSSRVLLLREHALTCSYWFSHLDPLGKNLFLRVDAVLPTETGRQAYLKQYRHWGRQMSQARLEGMAIPKQTRDFIMENEAIAPPPFFYCSVALDFLRDNYLPDSVLALRKHRHKESMGAAQRFYDRASARAREAACLLGVYLEYSQYAGISDFSFLLERMIFTIIALNPVLRLGMPWKFGDFVRRSMVSLAQYTYEQQSGILSCMQDVPPLFYDDLAECLAELSNLMIHLGPYTAEGDNLMGNAW